nr:copia protein [Tanacetum cinerariifolium]
MDVEVEKDDLNQKFLTSLALEWLMHTISNGSQIKFEDIIQIDEDDMEDMDIKWSRALLTMRADKFRKRTGKKISIQGSDVARLTEYKEREVKYIEKIRTLEMYRASNLNCIKTLDKELEKLKLEKDGLDGKLAGLLKVSKNLDHLIESQRSDQVKEGVRYNVVPPPAADLYPSTSAESQNKDSSTSEDVASPNPPKPFVKFVKPKDNQPKSKTKEQETPKKPQVKYAKQYRHSNKRPKGNQRNWNILSIRRRVQRETTRSQNHTYMGSSHRFAGHRPHGAPMITPYKSVGHRPHGLSMRPSNRPAGHRPHGPSMNPIRPNMNGARPNRSFFIQAPSYETRPFFKSSAVKTSYRAPWVPIVNRNNPPVNRKFSTGRRNFPTANRKFPTAGRKFTTGSTKVYTADLGRKGKAVKPSACWTWNPSQILSNKGPINNSVSVVFKKYTYIDTQGRLKSGEFNSDFHPMVDFIAASPLRIETTDEGTYILATGDGIQRTISESSPRRNLKLRDEEGIVSIPDSELFENLTLMGAICIVKNPVYHSKTKHIEIRHHFIRDCFEKKLISVDHVHTDENVADLLTKPFDAERFQYLVYKLAAVGYFSTALFPLPVQTFPTTGKTFHLEPKKVSNALQDPSWVEAMQKELLQFKIQKVWTLVDCPKRVRPIGTKWVLKNKKDERGIIVRNKARLVAQGHTQEEGIDYDEVFAPAARIEAIRLFLAYASFMGFTVYQMDENPWGKDGTGKDVDLHLYISMIGSLIYLTASRPDIMFAVCACDRHQ